MEKCSINFVPITTDVFDDIVSPLVAGQNFMTQACTKRKGMLDLVVAFCVGVLTTPTDHLDYRKKDGALHVIGSLYEVLVKVSIHCTCVYVCMYIYVLYSRGDRSHQGLYFSTFILRRAYIQVFIQEGGVFCHPTNFCTPYTLAMTAARLVMKRGLYFFICARGTYTNFCLRGNSDHVSTVSGFSH